jgi:hypothetical protein
MVLAVAKGDTRAIVDRSMEHLASVGTNVVGMVFNRALDRDVIAYSGSSSQGLRSTGGNGSGNGHGSGHAIPAGIEHRDVPGTERLGPVARAVASWSPAMGMGSRRSRVREVRARGR